MKKTLAEKLENKHFKRPPRVIYPLLKKIVLGSQAKKWNVEFSSSVDTKKIKTPFVVVYNHQSRYDYVFTAMSFPKTRLNFIAGYNEFFRSHLKFIFNLCGAIPKRNFTPDIHTVKEAIRIIKKKGAICIAPEGMSSISGGNQPVAIGTGKFLKHLNVPVYCVHIKGAYLMAPKYSLDDRIGKVSVHTDLLFDTETLNTLSVSEIEDKLMTAISHDDYEYNKKMQISYTGDKKANNMHTYLYRCPKCGKEFTMKSTADTIYCTECGNGAKLDDKYNLIPFNSDCVIPETPKAWYDWQRKMVYREIKANKDYKLSEHVSLGTLPDYHYLKNKATSEIVGDGELSISREGLTFNGVKNGEPFTFTLSTNEVPTYGMCTDMTRFYTFYQKKFYEFYPDTESVCKWLLTTEELHRINGGPWKNFKNATTYDED